MQSEGNLNERAHAQLKDMHYLLEEAAALLARSSTVRLEMAPSTADRHNEVGLNS